MKDKALVQAIVATITTIILAVLSYAGAAHTQDAVTGMWFGAASWFTGLGAVLTAMAAVTCFMSTLDDHFG